MAEGMHVRLRAGAIVALGAILGSTVALAPVYAQAPVRGPAKAKAQRWVLKDLGPPNLIRYCRRLHKSPRAVFRAKSKRWACLRTRGRRWRNVNLSRACGMTHRTLRYRQRGRQVSCLIRVRRGQPTSGEPNLVRYCSERHPGSRLFYRDETKRWACMIPGTARWQRVDLAEACRMTHETRFYRTRGRSVRCLIAPPRRKRSSRQ